MLTIVFDDPSGMGHQHFTAASFYAIGGLLRESEGDTEIARHAHAFWHVADRLHVTAHIDAPVRVVFSDPERGLEADLGIHHSIRLVDGTLRGGAEELLLARYYDRRGAWTLADNKQTMPKMLLEPA